MSKVWVERWRTARQPLRRDFVVKTAALGFQGIELLPCLILFSVMATNKTQGWVGDSFDRYKEYRLQVRPSYCVRNQRLGTSRASQCFQGGDVIQRSLALVSSLKPSISGLCLIIFLYIRRSRSSKEKKKKKKDQDSH
ncbi:CASP-like protein 4A2 [Rosa sericea]